MQTTLSFLKELAKNNNKEWFDANRKTYETAKKESEQLVKNLIEKCTSFDKELIGLEPKNCLFRINKDIRFSKDKTPYKKNMGGSINPGGKKSMSPCYYLHIEPQKSFLAGGSYMPPTEFLNAIRQEIDYHSAEFKKILNHKDFKANFNGLSEDDKLKTAPKGYEKTHPEISLLQHKHFIVMHPLKDKDLTDKDFPAYAAKIFKSMYPLNAFLRRCLESV